MYGRLKENRIRAIGSELKRNRILFLLLLPTLVYFIIFGYVLMPGGYIAFVNYKYTTGIFAYNMFNYSTGSVNGLLVAMGLERHAFTHPYAGFAFDSSTVDAEIATVSQVNSGIGIQILLGKVEDVEVAVEEFRAQLTAAGIDVIMQEAIRQATEAGIK